MNGSVRPQIWHYGLVALDWAEFNTEGGKEGLYFTQLVKNAGEPALDLGCGSGRLLIPMLQAGLEVDGCDYSGDMLSVCREHLAKQGLTTNLYSQAMHALDLPRRYRTIFACGVVGLGGEQRLTQQAMQRCYEHLRPGGAFAFDYMVRYNDPPAWLARLAENRKHEPQEWPPASERQPMRDGCEMEVATRTISTDPLENVAVRQIRVRLWRGEELLKEEVHTQKVEDYTKNELLLMLEQAGFEEIQIYGNYSDEPATADHENLIFVARK